MKNEESWIPTKFLPTKNKYKPNKKIVSSGSFYISQLQVDIYQEFIKKYAKGNFLDCGCGSVPYYSIYKPLVSDITCVDWSFSLHGTNHVDLEVDLNGTIPIDENTFDSAILTDVLEHIHNPGLLVSELNRILKPEGVLILAVPFFYWIHESPHDYHRYTKYALMQYMEKNGLEILRLEAYGGFLDVIFDLLNKTIFRQTFIARLFVKFGLFSRRLFFLKKLNKKSEGHFPLGYILVARKK